MLLMKALIQSITPVIYFVSITKRKNQFKLTVINLRGIKT